MSPITKKIRNSTVFYKKSEDFPTMFRINGKYFCNNDFVKECQEVSGLPLKYEPVDEIEEQQQILQNSNISHITNTTGNLINSKPFINDSVSPVVDLLVQLSSLQEQLLQNSSFSESVLGPSEPNITEKMPNISDSGLQLSSLQEVKSDLSVPALTNNLGELPTQNNSEADFSKILPNISNQIANSKEASNSYWIWFDYFIYLLIALFAVRVFHSIVVFTPYFGSLNEYLNAKNFFLYVFRGHATMLDHIDEERHQYIRDVNKEYNKQANAIKQNQNQ